ncbi:MAG: SpiroCoCo family coiled-coil protein [Spirochaetia bacterium]
MGIFDIGDLIVLSVASLLVFVARKLDQQNRSLDNVRRFFDKTRADFDAYMKANQERLYDLTSELSSYDKTSKEVLRRIEIDAQEVREQAENLNQVKEVMVELLNVRDNVMESLENLKDDAAYVGETSRRIEALGQKVQQVEANAERLLAELADRNEKSLDLQRQEFGMSLEKEREMVKVELAKTGQAIASLHQELNGVLSQKEEILVRNLQAYSAELERIEDVYTKHLQEMESKAMQMETEGLLQIKDNLKQEFARIQEAAGQMFTHETLRFKEALEEQVGKFSDFSVHYRELEEGVTQKFEELSLKSHKIAEDYNQFDIRMHGLYDYIQNSFKDEARMLRDEIDVRTSGLRSDVEERYQKDLDAAGVAINEKLATIEQVASTAEGRAFELEARISQDHDKISVSLAEMNLGIEEERRAMAQELERHKDEWQRSFSELTEHYSQWQAQVRDSLVSEHENVMNQFEQQAAGLQQQWRDMSEEIQESRQRIQARLREEGTGYEELLSAYNNEINEKIEAIRLKVEDSVDQTQARIVAGEDRVKQKIADEQDFLRREIQNLAEDFERAKEESRNLVSVAHADIFNEAKERVSQEVAQMESGIRENLGLMQGRLDQDLSDSEARSASLQQRYDDLSDNIQQRYEALEGDVQRRYSDLENSLHAKINSTEDFYNTIVQEMRNKQDDLFGMDDEWKMRFRDLQNDLTTELRGAVEQWKTVAEESYQQALTDGQSRYGLALDKIAEELDRRISDSILRLENLQSSFTEYQQTIEKEQQDQKRYVDEYLSQWRTDFEEERNRINDETAGTFQRYVQDTADLMQDWRSSVHRWQDDAKNLTEQLQAQALSVEEEVRDIQTRWQDSFSDHEQSWRARWNDWCEVQNQLIEGDRTRYDSMVSDIREMAENFENEFSVFKQEMHTRNESAREEWGATVSSMGEDWREQLSLMQASVAQHVAEVERIGQEYEGSVSAQIEKLDNEVQARIGGIAHNIDEHQRKWQEIEYSLTDKIGAQQFYLDGVMKTWREALANYEEESAQALTKERQALEDRIQGAKDELSETILELFEQGKGQISHIAVQWQGEMARLEEQVQSHILATKNLGDSCEAAMQHQVDLLTTKIDQQVAEINRTLQSQEQIWHDTNESLARQIDEQKDYVNETILGWENKVSMHEQDARDAILDHKHSFEVALGQARSDFLAQIDDVKTQGVSDIEHLEGHWRSELELLAQRVDGHLQSTNELGEKYNHDVQAVFDAFKKEAEGDLTVVSDQIRAHQEEWAVFQENLQNQVGQQREFVDQSVNAWHAQLAEELEAKRLLVERDQGLIGERITQVQLEIAQDIDRVLEMGESERQRLHDQWQQEIAALEKEVAGHIAMTQQLGQEYQAAINEQFDDINAQAEKRIAGIDEKLGAQELQWEELQLQLSEQMADYRRGVQENAEALHQQVLVLVSQNRDAIDQEHQVFTGQLKELSQELSLGMENLGGRIKTDIAHTTSSWEQEVERLNNELQGHVHTLHTMSDGYQKSLNEKFDLLDQLIESHSGNLSDALGKQSDSWDQSLSIWKDKIGTIEEYIKSYADERKADLGREFDDWQKEFKKKVEDQEAYLGDVRQHWGIELEKFHDQMSAELVQVQANLLGSYDELKQEITQDFSSYEETMKRLSAQQSDHVTQWQESLNALAAQLESDAGNIRDEIARQIAEDRNKWDESFNQNVEESNHKLNQINAQIYELTQKMGDELTQKLTDIREKQDLAVADWSRAHEQLQEVYLQHQNDVRAQSEDIYRLIDQKVDSFNEDLAKKFINVEQGIDENLAQVNVRSELIEAAWQQRYEQHTREFAQRLNEREDNINDTLAQWKSRLDHMRSEVDGRLGEATRLADEVSGHWKDGFEELQRVMEEKARTSKEQLEAVETNWQQQISEVQRLITDRLEGSRDWADNIEKEWQQRYQDTEKQLRERTNQVNDLVNQIETSWQTRYGEFKDKFESKSQDLDNILQAHNQELRQKVQDWEELYKARQFDADKAAEDLSSVWRLRFEELKQEVLDRENDIHAAGQRIQESWQRSYDDLGQLLEERTQVATQRVDEFIQNLGTKESDWENAFRVKCREIEEKNQQLIDESEKQFATSRDAYQSQMKMIQDQVEEIRNHWKANYDVLAEKLDEHIQIINKESEGIEQVWHQELENLRKVSVKKQEESKSLIDELEQTWRRRFKNFNQGLESWLKGNDEKFEQRVQDLNQQWEERIGDLEKLDHAREQDVQNTRDQLAQDWRDKADELSETLQTYIRSSQGLIEDELHQAGRVWQEKIDVLGQEIEKKVEAVSGQTRAIENEWKKELDVLDQAIHIQEQEFNRRKEDFEGLLSQQMGFLDEIKEGIEHKAQEEIDRIALIWKEKYEALNSQFGDRVLAVDQFANDVEQNWKDRMSLLSDQIEHYGSELQARLEGLDQNKVLIDDRLRSLESSIEQHFSSQEESLQHQVSQRLAILAEETRADWEERLSDVKKTFALRVDELESAAVGLRENQSEAEAEKTLFFSRLQSMMAEMEAVYADSRLWVEKHTDEMRDHLQNTDHAWHRELINLTNRIETERKKLEESQEQLLSRLDVLEQNAGSQILTLQTAWDQFSQQIDHDKDEFSQQLTQQMQEFDKNVKTIKEQYAQCRSELDTNWSKYTNELEEKSSLALSSQQVLAENSYQKLTQVLDSTEQKLLEMKNQYEGRFETVAADFEHKFSQASSTHAADIIKMEALYRDSIDRTQELNSAVEEYTQSQKTYIEEQEESFRREWHSLLTNLSDQQAVFEEKWNKQMSYWKDKELGLDELQSQIMQENESQVVQIKAQLEEKIKKLTQDYEQSFVLQLQDNQANFQQTQVSVTEDLKRLQALYETNISKVDRIAVSLDEQLEAKKRIFEEKEQALQAEWGVFFDQLATQKATLEDQWQEYAKSLQSQQLELGHVQDRLAQESQEKVNIALDEISHKLKAIQSDYEDRFHAHLKESYGQISSDKELQERLIQEMVAEQKAKLEELTKINETIQQELTMHRSHFDHQIQSQQDQWATLLEGLTSHQNDITETWKKQLDLTHQNQQEYEQAREVLVHSNHEQMDQLKAEIHAQIGDIELAHQNWEEQFTGIQQLAKDELERQMTQLSAALAHKEQEYLQGFDTRTKDILDTYAHEFEKERATLSELFEKRQTELESGWIQQQEKLEQEKQIYFEKWQSQLEQIGAQHGQQIQDIHAQQTNNLTQLRESTREMQEEVTHFLDNARVEIGRGIDGANHILAQFDTDLKHRQDGYFQELEQNMDKLNVYRERLEEHLHKEKDLLQARFAARMTEVEESWAQFNQGLAEQQNRFDQSIVERMSLADAQLATLEERLAIKENRFEDSFSERLSQSVDRLHELEADLGQKQNQFEQGLLDRLNQAGEGLQKLEASFAEKREQFAQMLNEKIIQAEDKVDNLALGFEARYESFELDFQKRMDKAMGDVHDLEKELIQGSQSLVKDSEDRLNEVQISLNQLITDLQMRQTTLYEEITQRIDGADARIQEQMQVLGIDFGELEKELAARRKLIDEHFEQQQESMKGRFGEVQTQIDEKIKQLLDQQQVLQQGVNQFKQEIDRHLDNHRDQIAQELDKQIKRSEEDITQMIFNQTRETEARISQLTEVVTQAEKEIDDRLQQHHERFKYHFMEIEQAVALAEQELERHKTEVEDGRLTLESRILVLRDSTNKELGRSTEELKAFIASNMQQTSEDLSLEFMGQLEQRLNDYEDALKTKMERLETFIHDVDNMEEVLRTSMAETANHVKKDMGAFENDIRTQHERELERAANMLGRTQTAISELESRVNDLRRQALDNVTGRLTEFEEGFLSEINRREDQLGQYIAEWQRTVEKNIESFDKRKQQERDDQERRFDQDSKVYFAKFQEQMDGDIAKFNGKLNDFIQDIQERSNKTQEEMSTLHEQLTSRMESFVYQANQQMDERLNALREDAVYQISDARTKTETEFNLIAQQLEEERRTFSSLLKEYQNDLEQWKQKNVVALEQRETDLVTHFDEFKQQVHTQLAEVQKDVLIEKDKMADQLKDQVVQLGKHFANERDEIVGASENERRRLKAELEEIAEKAQLLSQGIERRSDMAVESLQKLGEEAVAELQRRGRTMQQEMEERLRDARLEAQELRERTEAVREQATQEIRSQSEKIVEQLQLIEQKQKEIEGNAAIFKKADEMRADLETALTDLAGRMERVEKHRHDMVELEAQLGRAFKVNDSLAEKLGDLTRERQRFDTLDEKMSRAMQLSEAVDNKLKQITEVSDTLQEIQVHLRELSVMEEDLQSRFERLDKKAMVADNTSKGIDDNFEKMRSLEQEIAKSLKDIQQMHASLESARTGLENVSSQKPQIDNLMGFVSTIDNKLKEMESRVEHIDQMRDWIVQAENRMQDIHQDIKSSVRMGSGKGVRETTGSASGGDDTNDTIIKLAQQGWTAEQIAAQLKVPVGQVSLIIDRWRSRR